MALRGIKFYIDGARRLFPECEDSNFQKWLKTIDFNIFDLYFKGEQERRSYHLATMEEWRVAEWERDLELVVLPGDTLINRKARLFRYLIGTENTIFYVKELMSNVLGIPYADVEHRHFKDIFPTDRVKRFSYALIAFIDPTTITFDKQSLIDEINEIHDIHCTLGGLVVALDFWEWGNATMTVGDVRYVTNIARLPITGSFQGDINPLGVTGFEPDGNEIQFEQFINSLCQEYYLFARPTITPSMQVRINGAANIIINGKHFRLAETTSPLFTAFNGVALLYAVDNGGVVEYRIATTGFTSGDPRSYNDVDALPVHAIAEITLTATTTEITEADIEDVRPAY